MMDVDFLPEHLVIVGGSYIGLEFGQMYRRFGIEVTIVEMGPRLIGREDEDVSQAVREILEAEGIKIRLNAKCISLAKRGSHIAVGLDCEEAPPEVLGTHVLLTVGRVPNTSDLGLDRAGVATDQRGYIIADDQLQTQCARHLGPGRLQWPRCLYATLHTTTMRLSPITCSMQIIAACQTESRRTLCI